MTFAAKHCDISHHTLYMLMCYLGKSKVHIYYKFGKKCKQICIDYTSASILLHLAELPVLISYLLFASVFVLYGANLNWLSAMHIKIC